MSKIKNRYDAEAHHFNDIDALGVFVDNHDNASFLHNHGARTSSSLLPPSSR